MTELPSDIEQYILDHINKEPEYLQHLNRETHAKILYSRMISGHLQGRILKMLCSMIRAKRILEIGTFTGYSSICMAEAMDENGIVETLEINDELENFIQDHITASGMAHKIKLHIGDALELIPQLQYSYDLAFIDGNKRYYLDYYHLIFDKIARGGYIIADNVLWSGKVIATADEHDLQTKGIQSFNDYIAQDQRVEKVILPIRDGLSIIRKL